MCSLCDQFSQKINEIGLVLQPNDTLNQANSFPFVTTASSLDSELN